MTPTPEEIEEALKWVKHDIEVNAGGISSNYEKWLSAALIQERALRKSAEALMRASGELRRQSGADDLICLLKQELPDNKDDDLTIFQKVTKLANLRYWEKERADKAESERDSLREQLAEAKAKILELMEEVEKLDNNQAKTGRV